MRKWKVWRHSRFLVMAIAITLAAAPAALAQTASSNNYKMTESEFGAISTKQTCSGQYCSTASIGSTGGRTSGATSTASFGQVTPEQPSLDIIIDSGTSDLGELDVVAPATKTSVVRVMSYLSNGYVMQVTGDPPKYGSHTIATPTTPTSSTPGTEQFGLNATVNTNPALGANPVQVPSGDTSFGFVEDDYKIPNKFMYVNGDVVGRSLKASGRTDYTLSFILNISSATPAGRYVGNYSIVVIPTF